MTTTPAQQPRNAPTSIKPWIPTTAPLLSLLLLACACGATPLRADPMAMPSGARSWITVQSNYSEKKGAVGNMPLTDNLSIHPDRGTVQASGSTDADSLGGFMRAVGDTGGFAFFFASKVDTFTLHSDDLADGTAVALSVLLTVDGTVTRPIGPQSPTSLPFGVGFIGANIGDWNPSTEPTLNEQFRVSSLAHNGVEFPPSRDSLSNVPVHFATQLDITRFIGSPFDMAFQLFLTPFNMEMDFAHTATISFVMADGVTVTSFDGFGAPPPSASVPEAGAALLMLAPALLGLALFRRRACATPAA